MHHLRLAAASATVVAVLIGFNAVPATAQTSGNGYAMQGGVEIARHPRTGLVTWMSGSPQQPIARPLGQSGGLGPEQAAAAFLDSQASAFGLRSGRAELAATGTENDNVGRAFVRFQQGYRGVPIIGAELNVQLDQGRNVVSVNGKSVGDLNMSVQPAVAAADATKTALVATARAHRVSPDVLTASTPSLAIHDARIMGGPPAPPALVWRVDVTSSTVDGIVEFVLVDAQNGRIAVQFNQAAHAAPPANAKQWVCDAANTSSKYPCTQADAVSAPGSSAITDVKKAFQFAEATYDFYARRFDRNSLDDKGLRLVSTVRFRHPNNPNQDYANAFWNSSTKQMVYGKDYASASDVVGHELSHGFTSFSSRLLYYYQSGAINESLSDIFGELIQRSVDNSQEWLMGEDLPIGAIRSLKDPTAFNDPDKMTSTLWTGDFGGTDAGGVHTNSGVGNKTAYLITDGDTFNGKTVTGIGLDKAAAIFYRVNAFILQSASDYADLGNALKQACKDLVGTQPKNKNGNPTAAITNQNCTQVGNAVLATELSQPPQHWPIPADAPFCAANKQPVNKVFERFEGKKAKFKFKPADARWELEDYYAASNTHAYYGSGNGQFDTNLASPAAVKVPAKAYLRFAHFHNLYSNRAGGVVEYQIGSGAWTRVPASMFLNNPYNATLLGGTGSALEGQQAFSGFSGGWTASRIDLASLAGKNVRFRFRMATDANGAWDGWIIDDIQIYTCAAADPQVALAR